MRFMIPLLAALASACTAVEWPDPASVSGKVVATDAWGQIETPAAISVTLDNLSSLGATDDLGGFQVLVPRGTHRISFAKNGYVTTAIQRFNASEPFPIDTAIARLPQHGAWIDSIVETRTATEQLLHVYVTLRTAPPGGTIPATPPAVTIPPLTALTSSAVLFIGRNLDVSSRVGLYVGAVMLTNQRPAGGAASALTQFEFKLDLNQLRGQFSTLPIFFAAYANSVSCGCDVDPVSAQRVYSHTGPTSNFKSWQITP